MYSRNYKNPALKHSFWMHVIKSAQPFKIIKFEFSLQHYDFSTLGEPKIELK